VWLQFKDLLSRSGDVPRTNYPFKISDYSIDAYRIHERHDSFWRLCVNINAFNGLFNCYQLCHVGFEQFTNLPLVFLED
jgi:hypothetical protein